MNMTSLPVKPDDGAVLRNPGCGLTYLQRGDNKMRHEDVAPDSFLLREKLADKIEFSIPWCVLEPEEGRYAWDHSDWEGCMDSWIRAGYKVGLQVRSMGTLGTFYNDGVPQWIFDAGAKFVDESPLIYPANFNPDSIQKMLTAGGGGGTAAILQSATSVGLLDKFPEPEHPVRYPVYWDPVYLDKVEQLVAAMGKRYNGKAGVDYIVIGCMGRWGEMHIAHHSPLAPWLAAGYSLKNYTRAYERVIDMYRRSFPDTGLVLEINAPCLDERPGNPDVHTIEDATPILDYAAAHRVGLKYNGLGYAYRGGRSPYLDSDIRAALTSRRSRTKIFLENLALPAAHEEALDCGISYWHRGGERQGLGETLIEKDIPVLKKKIFSYYPHFPEKFDALTVEDQKDIYRRMALRCGYRLVLEEAAIARTLKAGSAFRAQLLFRNTGAAACHERLKLTLELACPRTGEAVWSDALDINAARFWERGTTLACDSDWLLPKNIPARQWHLCLRLGTVSRPPRQVRLANGGCADDDSLPLATVVTVL